jgi:hypothetical protein
VAWTVLEAVCERAERDGARTVSWCSVRGLAGELGIANDTAARALRRLGDAGLLHHESDREASGRFGAGRYVLTLPPNVLDDANPTRRLEPAAPSTKRRVVQSAGEQLALLSPD